MYFYVGFRIRDKQGYGDTFHLKILNPEIETFLKNT